jgi:hypothetical protein
MLKVGDHIRIVKGMMIDVGQLATVVSIDDDFRYTIHITSRNENIKRIKSASEIALVEVWPPDE